MKHDFETFLESLNTADSIKVRQWLMKRTKKKTEIVIPGIREQDWEKDLKNLDHYQAEGMEERPPVWRCYLCKRLEGEESLGIDFDKHTIHRPRLALDEFKVVPGGVSWIYHLCLECFVLMRHLSEFCRK